MTQERAEHVLVCFTGRWEEDAAPGLLLAWRPPREGRGWEGWVITAEPACDGRGDPFVRQLWVAASCIRAVSVGGAGRSANATNR